MSTSVKQYFLPVLIVWFVLLSLLSNADCEQAVKVTADPRIELLSVVMYLSDYTGFNGVPILTRFDFPYKREAAERFAAYADHPAVTMFDEMSAEGFWYGQPPEAVLSYSQPPDLRQIRPVSPFIAGRAGGKERLDTFIRRLADFAEETRFMDFYRAHATDYDAIIADYRTIMGEHDYIADLEGFYGDPQNSYTIVVAPFFHPGGFGPRIEAGDGRYDVYNLCGPYGYEDGHFSFGGEREFRRIVWHEFSHSYVNHLTDLYMDRLVPAVDRLNPGMREKIDAMENVTFDVYAHEWVSEHIVRAVTTHFAYTVLGETDGDAALALEKKAGYPYAGDLCAALDIYVANRDRYPEFDTFFPELAAVFEHLAASRQP